MNGRRYVTLGDGRTITIRSYVRGVKLAKQHPDYLFERGINGWSQTGREVVRSFRRGMHERISAGVPYSARGLDNGRADI